MYTLQCPGGYPMPMKKGKFELIGLCVTVSAPTADSQFAIVDDDNITDNVNTGFVLSTLTNKRGVLANLKGLADIDTVLSYEFSDPIKTRYGLSVLATNTVPGSICVYVR